MYVNRYLIEQEIPKGLRTKVKRYLEFSFESMKEINMTEEETLELLNEDLKEKIQIHLKSKILYQIHFLKDFGLDFICECTKVLKNMISVSDDYIFMEKDRADCFYFIVQG